MCAPSPASKSQSSGLRALPRRRPREEGWERVHALEEVPRNVSSMPVKDSLAAVETNDGWRRGGVVREAIEERRRGRGRTRRDRRVIEAERKSGGGCSSGGG